MIEAGVCPRLVELLLYVNLAHKFYADFFNSLLFTLISVLCVMCSGTTCSHPSPSVLIPALRTVGNIVTGDDLQTQVGHISFVSTINYIAFEYLRRRCVMGSLS